MSHSPCRPVIPLPTLWFTPWGAVGLLLACSTWASEALIVPNVAVLAATCANCHGPHGHSPGDIPSLRGLPADYLLQRMLAFKNGAAHDATVMTRLMAGYDEAQIQALARWFATQGER